MNTGWTNMEMDKEGKEIFDFGRKHHAEDECRFRNIKAHKL